MKLLYIFRLLVLLLVVLVSGSNESRAQPLRLAVAANAQFVVKALQADFKQKTGIETEAIIGSSGNLSTQIKNGAPFDVFLSADMDFPTSLYKAGFGITKPIEYALGSLVVCSLTEIEIRNWKKLLPTGTVTKVAIANPAVAPYGKAAEEALRHYALWDQLQNKMVFGESISQVNTYITTGTVTIGFTTEALVYEYAGSKKLKWERVDRNVYEKIRQGFILLSYAKKTNYEKAKKFYDYLLSAPAKKIFKQFGYLLP